MSLIIFDGWNIVRRAHKAIKIDDETERARQTYQTSMRTFGRVMRQFRPTYGVVAWDFGGQTWRHRLYDRYKEGREASPTELRDGLSVFQSALESIHGLTSVSIPDVEADDVIAALAMRWSRTLTEPCIVVSTDKDLASLAADRVIVFDAFEKVIRHYDWCVGRYGVPPHRLLDYLALLGDTTDAVPGVEGIGKVKARQLLDDFGSLDEILRNSASIPGSLGRHLVEGQAAAKLSRQLVDFKTDMTLGLTWSQLRLKPDVSPAKPDARSAA